MTRGWFDWREGSAGWPGAVVAVAFTVLGVTMIFEPTRYNHSVPYGTLAQLLDIRWWGVLYLSVAILKAFYLTMFRLRRLALVVHTAAFILTGWWLVALLISYRTEEYATVVSSLLWGILLVLILRSVTLMPQDGRRHHDGGALDERR